MPNVVPQFTVLYDILVYCIWWFLKLVMVSSSCKDGWSDGIRNVGALWRTVSTIPLIRHPWDSADSRRYCLIVPITTRLCGRNLMVPI